MGENVEEVLVREVARRIVEDVAPAELPMFAPASRRYFTDPRWISAGKRGDSLLAFDTAQVTALVTPVALVAATQVTQHLVTQLMERGVPNATRAVRGLLRLPVAAAAPSDAEVSLTDAEWVWIRRTIIEVAERGGVGPELAQMIAEAVVGRGRLNGEEP